MLPIRKKRLIILLLLALCATALPLASAGFRWGFFAHRKINRTAVFTLPAPMQRFYKNNLDYLTERAVSADKRRYVLDGEAARHYFDTEFYGEDFLYAEPLTWNEMQERFPGGGFQQHGILPWHILRVSQLLTRAFQDRDSANILRHSADLGHYLADAHVPLHTTQNYNGQLTGQTGIHAFWESRIPELFSHHYDYLTGKSRYIPNRPDRIWNIVRESHRAVDSVLSIEKTVSARFPSDRKYTVYLKNNQAVRNYSRRFSARYQEQLQGMVERRLRASIHTVGSFWYTAWVNAGQPPLESWENEYLKKPKP